MTVTDIRKIDDKRYCLYIDYEPFSAVYSSDIRRLKLKVGEEVEEESMDSFRREYLFRRALNKAVNSIKFSDKCEYDIRQKLRELYYDGEIIDHTVDKLKSYGYIDDYRYAGGYIRRHLAKKGLRVIEYELSAKRIPQDIIEQAVADAEIPDEMDTIASIIRKRYSFNDLTAKRDKIMAYMYGKGFDHRKVSACIRQMQIELSGDMSDSPYNESNDL